MTGSTAPLVNQQALRHHGNKALLPSFSHWDVLAQEHAIAFSVAKMMDEDLLAETHAAIQDALKHGTDFNAFKQRLMPYLMARGWWGRQVMGDPMTGEIKKVQLGSYRRLRTIYHTNLHSAYTAGQWQRIQDSKMALPYLQYMPSMSENPRYEHRHYYGLVRPVDDPIWQSILPPNGYGCLCWVKQLTKAQAEKIGISPEQKLVYEKITNTRTGEEVKTPLGIEPSFAHNHDRLSAMRKLYAEKLKTWSHISDKTAYQQAFDLELNRYMLDLVEQPDFNSMVSTVVGQDFARRFEELAAAVKTAGGRRENSEQLQRQLSRKEKWVAATLSPEIQEKWQSQTALIYLSEDSLIKELCNHAEIAPTRLFTLFQDTAFLLKNAEVVKQIAENKYVYFSVADRHYEAIVKSVKGKELYLLSLFEMDEKSYVKEKARLLKK